MASFQQLYIRKTGLIKNSDHFAQALLSQTLLIKGMYLEIRSFFYILQSFQKWVLYILIMILFYSKFFLNLAMSN